MNVKKVGNGIEFGIENKSSFLNEKECATLASIIITHLMSDKNILVIEKKDGSPMFTILSMKDEEEIKVETTEDGFYVSCKIKGCSYAQKYNSVDENHMLYAKDKREAISKFTAFYSKFWNGGE